MKDKKITRRKFIVAALFIAAALLLILTLTFVCCGKNKSGGDSGKPAPVPHNGKDYLTVDVSADSSGGIHKVSVKDSDIKFIEDGRCDYEIVIPENANSILCEAANELNVFINESADITLNIIEDSVCTWNTNSVYIVLGKDNSILLKAGVKIPSAVLGERGAFVTTEGNSVFIAGNTPEGTVNGVYEWLHYQLDYEYYGPEEITIKREVENLNLKDIELTEVPDIEYLASTYGWTDNDTKVMRRMRYTGSFWIPIKNLVYHNSFGYIDPEIYNDGGNQGQYHPEWFSDDGLNLCYTAHGDENGVKQMVETAGGVLKEALKKYPELNHVTFTQQDTPSWCTCKACSELYNKYGTNAVGPIYFCNQLDEYIRKWFGTPEGMEYKRNLKISFFAYHATERAPVVYDEKTDTYYPIDDSVKLNDNVGIIHAPINVSYQLPLNDDYNKKSYDNIRAWTAVCKNINMWTYSTNFHYYLVPTNTYNSMQFNYRFLSECGTEWYVDQAAYCNIVSGFSALKLYLNSKLAWNTNSDFTALIEKFFKNYFGPAGKFMKKYFDELRVHWEYTESDLGYIGDCYLEPLKPEYWPKPVLERWLKYSEGAKAALEPLKDSDPKAYKRYMDNVLLETLSPRYLLIELWPLKFDSVNLHDMKTSFRDDCMKLNVTSFSEHEEISALWSKWEI